MNPKKYRRPCEMCGRTVNQVVAKYCSLKCQHANQHRLRIELVESGKYPSFENPRFLRKYLLLKLGERCSRCGWAERHSLTGRVPVEVEHIDGDWKNNRPANLTLLCPNCHALTATYRGLNRGRGRAKRLGGRENPFRRAAPMPRSQVASVEPKVPSKADDAGVP